MRITVALDDDVAAEIQRLRQSRRTSLKSLVNQALRHGLKAIQGPQPNRKPYVTPASDLGRCLVGNVDNIAEVIAVAEGEDHR